ncbi:nucleoside 2-deoxyribosyltransferase [Xanthobacteraceae bacterium A53D]
MARVYLAGPEVFRPDAAAEGERLKALCAARGLVPIYPLDGGGPQDAPHEIRERCLSGIKAADVVVANVSPFRGAHMDPGTAFEIGYAEARGVPVVLWSSDPREMVARIPGLPGDGGLRDGDGHLVEDFGQPENLMICPPGAKVCASPEEAIAAAARLIELAGSRGMGLVSKIMIAWAVAMLAGWLFW